MTGRNDPERILDAYLAPEHDRLADRVVDAAFAESPGPHSGARCACRGGTP